MMKRYIFWGIIIIAAFFRLYNLPTVPPSPSLDEVSIGYNAFSLLRTGRDEYGTVLPLLLRAYDDYRPALYVYLTIPFVAVMGLTAAAVRMPSVLLSLITVWAAYGIGSIIGKKLGKAEHFSFIPALLLAISPWHIYISRLGHEANLGLTLVALGIYFFLDAAERGNKYGWILSAVCMGLSLHGYQSEKLVSPLITGAGAVVYWRQVVKAKYTAAIAVIVGIVIALPAVAITLSPQGMARFSGTSAFSPDDPQVAAAVKKYVTARENNDRLGQVMNSKYVTYPTIFAKNYVSHFSPSWLFAGGDREAHKVPGLGLMYWWEAPFLLAGFAALARSGLPVSIIVFILVSLFSAFIPAAMTTQSPHAMRAYTVIPAVQVVVALGLWWIIRSLDIPKRRFFMIVLGIVIAGSLQTFWHGYFTRFPREQSGDFQYAMAAAVSYAEKQKNDYDRIEVANQGTLNQSYMFFLFYTAFDPKRYLALGGTETGRFEASHSFDRYAFGFLPQKEEDMVSGTLYLYDKDHIPAGARVIERFSDVDGSMAIVAVRK